MNVRMAFVLTLVLALTTVSAGHAAPGVGTNKALGIYNGFGWESQGMARSRSSYSYGASTTTSAPRVQSAPMVAQAPVEGRRFSHDPSATSENTTPCPQGQVHAAATAATVGGDRRYSYAPIVEATAPSRTSTRTYNSRPSYSSGGGSRSSVDRWALQKTDARKYNGR